MDIKDAILMVVLTLIGCATFLGSCYMVTSAPTDSYACTEWHVCND